MASFAHRLICAAMALALSGSPAVLSACMALCLDNPVAANTTDTTQVDHYGHGTTTEPAVASTHAHHGAAASTQPTSSESNGSSLAQSDARLVGSCDDCCVTGPVAFAAGVERADSKALAMAPTVSVASFHLSATTHAASPPGPPVPPPSPTRAPLELRI